MATQLQHQTNVIRIMQFTKDGFVLMQCSSYPVERFYVAWASQDYRHWLLTAKSWLWYFVYTRKPMRTAHKTYKRGSLHWSSTFFKMEVILCLQTIEYYFQVQGQIGIIERPHCDFVCWTLVGIDQEQIKCDPALFRQMNAKLHCLFVPVIFTRVLSGPKEWSYRILLWLSQTIVNMALCDSTSCKYGWFHFPCVNLRVAPAGGCQVLSQLQTVNVTLYITLPTCKCMTLCFPLE